ncbi:helix-turn-helix transcriptional regulator [Fusibacter paucivorans]|uniref:Helix-turn-helix transcriptional regulator n=1 Tax=Fusibacter paucivorans TaxID=76009 RepID=A0ABS5PU29_9FIRM|nr:helix-turn-helix transcriptional regulator [Fusibacter paucivorans]MBS7528674.1 helix-turn-helix transcriptional regulator [Fusibacter paucivorans]
MNRLAEKIKKARLQAGLTEKELAKKCGLQISYILQIESGKKIINEQIADQILKALGTKVAPLSEQASDYDRANSSQPQKSKLVQQEKVQKPVEPNAQWAGIIGQLIYEVPVIDLAKNTQIAVIPHPVLQNKVEGHNGDKLYYIHLSSDCDLKLRLRKGDKVLTLKTKSVMTGAVMHFKYQNKYYVGRIQTLDRNMVIVTSDMIKKEIPQKDIEIIGQCLKVVFDL